MERIHAMRRFTLVSNCSMIGCRKKEEGVIMSMPIYITGHKNPDSDSICAAIAYAYLKGELNQEAKACRLGKLNAETQFILDTFKVPAPELISSAKASIKEIDIDPVVVAKHDDTIRHVWDLCLAHNTKTVYVMDAQSKMIGLTSMSGVSKVQMQDLNMTAELLKETPLDNLVKSLKGEYIHKGTLARSGYVRINDNQLMSRDLVGAIMALSDNEDVMIKCMSKGCSVIAISEKYTPSSFTIKMAQELGVTLISTNYNVMKIIQMIYRSIPASSIMIPVEKLVKFNGNEYVEDVGKIMLKSRYRSYPVFLNDELIGSLARYHLLSYKKKDFILVDHNEQSQTIDDIEHANILEIIDHHRIGDIETSQPIIFRNSRVGSTCTIIANLYKENGVDIPKDMASIMCSAIISDTMNFNSPTCTQVDVDVANAMAKQHDINLHVLAKDIFQATATLDGKENVDILYTDFKEYELDGFSIAIGQTNVFDLGCVKDIREGFQNFLDTENQRFKYDLLMMVFSNVEGKGSKFVFSGKLSNIIEKDFTNPSDTDGYLAGFVSRKKQIIPKIASLLK